MKKQILLLVIVAFATSVFAQTKNVIVTLGATSTAYTDLPSAIAAAGNGATIYVPGGIHTLSSNITISKQLHFRGDGFNPLTLASGLTPVISGSKLILTRGAHYSSFEGLYFANVVELKHTAADTTGYFYLTFNRCKFDNSITSSTGTNLIGNICLYMNECVIYGISFWSSNEAVNISNSIFTQAEIGNVDQGFIKNSILLYGSSLAGTRNLTIRNCIIYSMIGGISTGINNVVTYCLLKTDATLYTPIGSSNNLWQDWNLIFENAPNNVYNNANNYHLKTGSLGIGAGNDGTDMGIYGGGTPWKENSIPASPNVYIKSVDTRNNSEGKIDVMYKVKAQSN